MVKYSGKVSLRAGSQKTVNEYDRFTCKGGFKQSCKSRNIYGTRGKTIFCKKHFYLAKKKTKDKGGNTSNFKIGYTPQKSKNQIPTCSKDACISKGYDEKENKMLCKFHYDRS